MDNVIDRELIGRLKEERGLTFAGIAAMVSERSPRGVSAQAIEGFFAGRHSLKVEYVAAIAAVLGVGISDIVKDAAPAAVNA